MRADLRCRVGQDGQRRLDRGDHPRGNPAASRIPEGASGYRIRFGERRSPIGATRTNLAVAFNEQVLLARHRLGALAPDATLLIEDKWATSEDEDIRKAWAEAMAELSHCSYRLIPVPMEAECLTIVDNARKGKNMFVLGLLAWIYDRDVERVREQIAFAFRKKSQKVFDQNVALFKLGYDWATEHLDFRVQVVPGTDPRIAGGDEWQRGDRLGAIAAGMELCAMYPITPATSVSHYLGEVFGKFGGLVHQAEDEIAAAGVAIGASYAGKVAFT